GTSFLSVLEQVRTWTLNSIAHQDLPYEDVYEDSFFEVAQNRIPDHVYFLYLKAFMQVQRVGSLQIEPRVSLSPGALYDLMLSIVERTEGPRLQLEYNRGSFRTSTIRWILQLNVHILESVMADATRTVRSLPAFQEDETLPSIFNGHGARKSDTRETSASADAQHSATESQATGRTRDGNVAPNGPLELQVCEIWESAMGCKVPSTRVTFFDLGGR